MDVNPMGLAELRRFLLSIPFNNLLGVRLVRLHPDGVTIECALRPELLNAAGVAHGGVTATLADVAVGMALTRRLGRPRAATTVEMKVNYMRPIAAGKIRARSYILRVGKHLCTARVDVTDSDRKLAAAALVLICCWIDRGNAQPGSACPLPFRTYNAVKTG